VADGPQKAVLMADDDAEDCMLASEALADSGVEVALSCVLDGVELMNHLMEYSHSEAKRLPDLILLNLAMPRKDGWQALIEIKAEPALQHIPVVILTSSQEQEDVDLSLKAGAESFITKPVTFDEWVEMMKSLEENWLR
jgi:CheY-like chemotaxis protein